MSKYERVVLSFAHTIGCGFISQQKLLTLLLLLNASAFSNLAFGIPYCNNTTEIKNFLLSDEYRAMYSFYAAIRIQTVSLNSSYDLLDSENYSDFDLRLNDILPENKSLYERRQPPELCDQPASVIFHLDVLSLDSVDEISMTYILDVWIAMSWFDSRLRYPKSTYDNYRILDPTWMNKIWIPDVIFNNARKVTFHELILPNHYLAILQNNAILHMSKLTLTLTCPMNLAKYPHDDQVCYLEMESMTYTTRKLSFSWDIKQGISVMRTETPQFSLVRYELKSCANSYLSGSFPCVRAQFHLRRRIGYHLIHTFLPSSLLVMLSWTTFWMKPEDLNTRFAVGLTLLLTLATLNKQTQESLPQVSYIKAVDIWLMTSSLFVIASILEFAFINYLIGTHPTNVGEDSNAQARDDFNRRSVQQLSRRIDEYSRFLFPGTFLFFSLWYWSAYALRTDMYNNSRSTKTF